MSHLFMVPDRLAPGAGAFRSTVLVVGNGPELRRCVCRWLEQERYSVLSASTAQDALRACEQSVWPVNIVISDLDAELAEQLARTRPEIPVLPLSSRYRRPYQREELLSAVRVLLNTVGHT